jgi:hypothetical protein
MKTFGGICGILLAIAIPVVGWFAYADLARLHDLGAEGVLRVLSKSGELRGPHGSVSRIYDGILADTRVRIKTGAIFEVGAEIPVLYSAGRLQGRLADDFFNDGVDYIAGRKSETKGQILVRELGWPSIWIIGVFEALVLAGSAWLLTKKTPNQTAQTTPGLRPSVSDL